jgi:hypothetical protein
VDAAEEVLMAVVHDHDEGAPCNRECVHHLNGKTIRVLDHDGCRACEPYIASAEGRPCYPTCATCGKQLTAADYSYGACRECDADVPNDW